MSKWNSTHIFKMWNGLNLNCNIFLLLNITRKSRKIALFEIRRNSKNECFQYRICDMHNIVWYERLLWSKVQLNKSQEIPVLRIKIYLSYIDLFHLNITFIIHWFKDWIFFAIIRYCSWIFYKGFKSKSFEMDVRPDIMSAHD